MGPAGGLLPGQGAIKTSDLSRVPRVSREPVVLTRVCSELFRISSRIDGVDAMTRIARHRRRRRGRVCAPRTEERRCPYDEAMDKTRPGTLKVYQYYGGKRTTDPSILKDNDIVITTYQVLVVT